MKVSALSKGKLVAAEGVADLNGVAWARRATREESLAFQANNPNAPWVDRTGRPYWLVAIYEDAPPEVLVKVSKFFVVREL